MNLIILRFVSALTCTLLFAMVTPSLQADTIVDDDFSDVDRTKTGALDANWWSSSSTSGNSIEIDGTGLGLVTGTSGRGIHATFTPQTLAVGHSIIASYIFNTPATVGSNKSTAFKVALMDGTNTGLAADLSSSSSSSNPLYVGLPGYMSDFDVNKTDGTDDVTIREHDLASLSGRFLGTTSEWINSSSSSDADYAFAANTEYTGVFSVTRTGADSVDVFSSMSNVGGLMDSHTKSYTGIANNFGMLGFWANSNTFGSTNSSDPDNGITFSRVTVVTQVPEPASAGLLLGGLVSLCMVRRRK